MEIAAISYRYDVEESIDGLNSLHLKRNRSINPEPPSGHISGLVGHGCDNIDATIVADRLQTRR